MTEARAAWGADDDPRLRDALDVVPAHYSIFLDAGGLAFSQMDEERLDHRALSRHRLQALVDFTSELSDACNDMERNASRRKYARPLQAWGEWHRRITTFGILLDDGSTASGLDDAAGALATHWAPVFDAGDDTSNSVAHRFLAH